MFEFLPSLKTLSTNDTVLNIGESLFLGAQVERQTLKEEIENYYLESQRKDAQKKAVKDKLKEPDEKEKKKCRGNSQSTARESSSRTLLTIVVRHVNIGTITQIFATNSKMNNVYDWVGSPSIHPVHFKLRQYQRIVAASGPAAKCDNTVLNME